jgi:hypothetical protein
VTSKETVLSEIRRIAKERGGHVSLRAFLGATGISVKQVLGRYWATWNEALAEAGVTTTSFFRPKVQEGPVVEALAHLVERLKKWPTQNELRLERNRNRSFPTLDVLRRVSEGAPLSSRVASYCADNSGLSTAARVAAERMEIEKATPVLLGRTPISGYVYMMRSRKRYKIGHTTSPARRHREVRLDLPDPTTVVHAISTDDPSGIEAYWHERFKAKRIRDTEFFTLDSSDVAGIALARRLALR